LRYAKEKGRKPMASATKSAGRFWETGEDPFRRHLMAIGLLQPYLRNHCLSAYRVTNVPLLLEGYVLEDKDSPKEPEAKIYRALVYYQDDESIRLLIKPDFFVTPEAAEKSLPGLLDAFPLIGFRPECVKQARPHWKKASKKALKTRTNKLK
jgi:hypothetical protein